MRGKEVLAPRGGPSEQPQAASGAQGASAQAWSVQYKPAGGVLVRYGSATIIDTELMFYGAERKWERSDVKELDPQGDAERFGIEIPGWGARIVGEAKPSGDRALVYDFDMTVGNAPAAIAGGGIEFRIHHQVLGRREGMQFPELLPDSRGFVWQVGNEGKVEVRFDKSIAMVFQQPNRPDIVRCFFVGESTKPGAQKFSMTVSVPQGGKVQKSLESGYARPSPQWHPNTLLWDRYPIDLRFLNASDRPAGQHGPVQAKGDALVFADGTPARFWGTNLQAGALFMSSKEKICEQAERIAAFGYNLARLHHHDVEWMNQNVFDRSTGSTQTLNTESMDKLDWWIKCLSDQGVYVWLDINVARYYPPGDKVPGGDEINKQMQAKGFSFVNPRIEQLMSKFAHDYLTHQNPYRKKRYVDDPAVAAMLITNENDLSTHFVHRMLPGRGAPQHMAMLGEALQKFAKSRDIDPVDVEDAWEPGEPTIAVVGVETGFFDRALRDLKGLGVKVPIATTSAWGNSNYALLPSLAMGGIVDVHSYGEAEYISTDPRGDSTILTWIAGSQVLGKPTSLSEWALEQNRRDRFMINLHFAAIASLQGWDMPIHFTYQQVPFLNAPDRLQMGSASYDPGTMAMMPAAALMFRRQDVQPAKKTYVLQPTADAIYKDKRSAVNARAGRTLSEQSRVVVAVPNIAELSVDDDVAKPPAPSATLEVVTDLDRDFVPPGSNAVRSDTGELMHDWAIGMHTVDTARSQVAAGWIGGREVQLKNATFRIKTPKVAIALTSLDGESIATSKRMLVSAAAQVVTTDADGRLPFRAEPVSGEIALRGTQSGLQLVAIMPDGSRGPVTAPTLKDGAQVFALPERVPTHWYVIEPATAASPAPAAKPTK